MKKPRAGILAAVTAVFAAFTLGLFLGRNYTQAAVIVSVPSAVQTAPDETTAAQIPATQSEVIFPININTASWEEFTALPGIGEVLARRIVSYRDANGSFSAPEGLMHVEGIGEKRMESILDLITTGG